MLAVDCHGVHGGGAPGGERLSTSLGWLACRLRKIRIVIIDGHGSQYLLGRRQLFGRAQIVVVASERASGGNAAEQIVRSARHGGHRFRIELLERAGPDGGSVPRRPGPGRRGSRLWLRRRLGLEDRDFPLPGRRWRGSCPLCIGGRRGPLCFRGAGGWRGPMRALWRRRNSTPPVICGLRGRHGRRPVRSAAQGAPVGQGRFRHRRRLGLAHFFPTLGRRFRLPFLRRFRRRGGPGVVRRGSLVFWRGRRAHVPGIRRARGTDRGRECRRGLRYGLAPRRRGRFRKRFRRRGRRRRRRRLVWFVCLCVRRNPPRLGNAVRAQRTAHAFGPVTGQRIHRRARGQSVVRERRRSGRTGLGHVRGRIPDGFQCRAKTLQIPDRWNLPTRAATL